MDRKKLFLKSRDAKNFKKTFLHFLRVKNMIASILNQGLKGDRQN